MRTRFVSSVELKRAQAFIPDPPVPRSYIKSQDRWEENPFDPAYATAVRQTTMRRAEFIATEVIRLGCDLLTELPGDDGWLRRLKRYNIAQDLLDSCDLDDIADRRFLYMAVEAIKSAEDMATIIDATVITEDEVRSFVRMIGVQRGGVSIDEAPTRNQVDTGIQAVILAVGTKLIVGPTDEYESCKSANLSWMSWRKGEYEKEFMVEVIAMNRLLQLIDTHRGDAQQTASAKKSRDIKAPA